jgi:hypothetical protein
MAWRRCVATVTAATLLSVTGAVLSTAGPASANSCTVTPAPGVSAVNVRNDKSVNASIAGTLYAGQYLPSLCHGESGGYYSACGTGSHWIWVDVGLFSRSVAAGCVRIVVDRLPG